MLVTRAGLECQAAQYDTENRYSDDSKGGDTNALGPMGALPGLAQDDVRARKMQQRGTLLTGVPLY